MNFPFQRLELAILLAGSAMALRADGGHGFNASLRDCTELIGFGPVDFAQARSLAPAGYTLVSINGSAGLVIRASRCEGASVDGSAEKPTIVAQVGIAVIPPDGTGDINNYTLQYATDHQQLAQALNQAGLPAVLDRAPAYEFTAGADGRGELYAAVSPALQPAWFLTGVAEPPPGAGGPVAANCRYGAANFSLHTSKVSILGSLIGGNTDASFVFFNGRGAFANGNLRASLK
jgi:hypothetical protein